MNQESFQSQLKESWQSQSQFSEKRRKESSQSQSQWADKKGNKFSVKKKESGQPQLTVNNKLSQLFIIIFQFSLCDTLRYFAKTFEKLCDITCLLRL